MELSKGLQTTGYPYKTEDGSWIRAINAILNDDAKSVSNERGMLSIKEDDYWFLGSIPADDGIFIFEQKLAIPVGGGWYNNSRFRITYIDLTNDSLSLSDFHIILNTRYITYDIQNTIDVIEGEFTYNKNKDRIIAWSGGKLYDTIDNLLNPGIHNRNLCILNVDTLPFVHGLVEDVNSPDYKEIIGITDGTMHNVNNEHLILFQNPTISVPIIELERISYSGGVLKSGTYRIAIQYGYTDGDWTNVVEISNGIPIIPGNRKASFNHIDGGYGNETTGKSLILNITRLDTKYDKFRILVYSIINGVHRAYEDLTYTIESDITNYNNLSKVVVVTGLHFHEIDINEILIDSMTINNTKSISQFENRLLIANTEEDEVIDLQPWALGFKVTNVYNDFVSITGNKGSYKDGYTVFNKTSFMPGEVYSLYVGGIMTNGKRTHPVHIPGREAVMTQYGFLENSKIVDILDNIPSSIINLNTALNINPNFKYNYAFTYLDNDMGYWENENEVYPNSDRFENAQLGISSLSGQKVRHHKLREQNTLTNLLTDVDSLVIHSGNTNTVYEDTGIEQHSTYINSDDSYDYDYRIFPYKPLTQGDDFLNYATIRRYGLIDKVAPSGTHPRPGSSHYTGNGSRVFPPYGGLAIIAKSPMKLSINGIAMTILEHFNTAITGMGRIYVAKLLSAPNNWSTIHASDIDSVILDTFIHFADYSIDDEVNYTTGNISLGIGEVLLVSIMTAGGCVTGDDPSHEQIVDASFMPTLNSKININYSIFDFNGYEGTKFGMIMGLKINNIILPKDIIDKLQGLEFFYAKRTIETASRICDVNPTDKTGLLNDSPLSYEARIHPFDLYQNGMKKIPMSYLLYHNMVDNDDNSLKYNADDSTVYNIGINGIDGIIDSKFMPVNNSKTNPSWTNKEEALYIQRSQGTIPNLHTASNKLLGVLCVYRDDMYINFDEKELVRTSKRVLLDNLEHYTNNLYKVKDSYLDTIVHYGGDSYIGLVGTPVTNNGSTVKLKYVPLRSMSNIGLRAGDDLEKLYYPRNLVSSFDITKENCWDYNIDYTIVNSIKTPFPYKLNYIYLSHFPNRIVRSAIQTKESSKLEWRKFKLADYYEIDKEKGIIISTGIFKQILIINLKNTTYLAKIKDVLKGSNAGEDTYLGKGDLFDREPEEIMTSDNGYAGCSHSNSTLSTRVGYIFIDSTRYKLFIFTGKELVELNNIGIKSIIDEIFINYPNLSDDILHNKGIAIAYDEENERLLFNFHVYDDTIFNTKTPLDRYPTLSFDLGKKRWIGYHNINISSFIQARNRLFGVINNINTSNYYISSSKLFEMNRNLYGLYNGNNSFHDHKPMSIDIVFNNKETIKDIYEAIVWETEVISKSRPNSNGVILDHLNNLLRVDMTITGIMIYNDTQCSEVIEVNNSNINTDPYTGQPTSDWYEEEQGRNNNGVWSFNDFRDAVVNNSIKFFDYVMEPTNNVDETLKDWQDEANFIGKFLVVRLIFNNVPHPEPDGTTTEYKIKINNVNINKRKSYK